MNTNTSRPNATIAERINALREANAAASAAAGAKTAANSALAAADADLAKASAALESAQAAIKSGNLTNEVKQKVNALEEIRVSVQTLDEQLATLDKFKNSGDFLNGKFGFKPTANSNANTTIGKSELNDALSALRAISSNATSGPNNSLGGSTFASAPMRKDVLKALLTGVVGLAKQAEKNHTNSLSGEEKAAAEAAAAAAKTRANAQSQAEAAAAAATASKNKKNQLTSNAIIAFNRALSQLAISAQNAIAKKVNAPQDGKTSKKQRLMNLLKGGSNGGFSLQNAESIKKAYENLTEAEGTKLSAYKAGIPELSGFSTQQLGRLERALKGVN